MPNYFYTDASGQKQQINDQQLQTLAAKGIITPTTPLETDSGHTGVAGQIPGLNFNTAAPPPFGQSAVPSPAANLFCTNCGSPVAEQAIACMSCGAKPVGHRRFCRQCGIALNPEQIVCIKCGAAIKTTGMLQFPGGGDFSYTGKALASLVLGIVGLIAWFIPLIGLPVTVVGLILGIIEMPGKGRGMAKVGVILCIIGLILTIINAAIGAYLGATGQLF